LHRARIGLIAQVLVHMLLGIVSRGQDVVLGVVVLAIGGVPLDVRVETAVVGSFIFHRVGMQLAPRLVAFGAESFLD
jgi:hypothetical protein